MKTLATAASLLSLAAASYATTCRCGPYDACWPSNSDWAALNATVGGRLIATIPMGSPCHDTTVLPFHNITNGYNATACQVVRDGWRIPEYMQNFPSSIMAPYYDHRSCNPFDPPSTLCQIGNYVRLAINVTEKADIVAALRFVKLHNIRLVIKNTGHE